MSSIHVQSMYSVHEIPRLCLFKSFTLPILTCGFDGFIVSRSHLDRLNVCWNKVFNQHKWEPEKYIQLQDNRLDFIRIVHSNLNVICHSSVLYKAL